MKLYRVQAKDRCKSRRSATGLPAGEARYVSKENNGSQISQNDDSSDHQTGVETLCLRIGQQLECAIEAGSALVNRFVSQLMLNRQVICTSALGVGAFTRRYFKDMCVKSSYGRSKDFLAL